MTENKETKFAESITIYVISPTIAFIFLKYIKKLYYFGACFILLL